MRKIKVEVRAAKAFGLWFGEAAENVLANRWILDTPIKYKTKAGALRAIKRACKRLGWEVVT